MSRYPDPGRRRLLTWSLAAAAGLGGGGQPTLAAQTSSNPERLPEAPEFAGITRWLNSPPLTMAGLRGQVVLVDFWTHGCSNCLPTLPYLQAWHTRLRPQGLVTVGVHAPEFPEEGRDAAVHAAVARLGLTYPVAQDTQHETWRAWRNRFWPALYLVDRRGRVVFHHVGEGDYERIEAAILQVLRQPA